MTYTNITKGLSRVGFTAAALAATALALPLSASAGSTGYYAGQNDPHEQCKADEKRDKIVGGVLGAVVGGVVGSNVAGSGVQDEGTAIGAVIGGLAGAGIADKRVDCDPVYTNSYGTTYDNGQYYPSQNQGVVYGDQSYRSPQPQPVYQNTGYNSGSYGSSYPVNCPAGTTAQTNGTCLQTAPVQYRTVSTQSTTYRPQPQPVYTRPVYQERTYNQGYYTQQKPQHVRRDRRKARKAARRAERRAVQGGHYHGAYVCHGHH